METVTTVLAVFLGVLLVLRVHEKRIDRWLIGEEVGPDLSFMKWTYPIWRLYANHVRHPLRLAWIHFWCGRREEAYWAWRCRHGFHQRNLYLATLTGKALPWCAWCRKQIGEAEPLTSQFKGIICGFCEKKRKIAG